MFLTLIQAGGLNLYVLYHLNLPLKECQRFHSPRELQSVNPETLKVVSFHGIHSLTLLNADSIRLAGSIIS
jgi:hypothetical protein